MSGGSARAYRGRPIGVASAGLTVLLTTASPGHAAAFDFSGLGNLPLSTLTLVVAGLAFLVFISALYTSHTSRRQVLDATESEIQNDVKVTISIMAISMPVNPSRPTSTTRANCRASASSR